MLLVQCIICMLTFMQYSICPCRYAPLGTRVVYISSWIELVGRRKVKRSFFPADKSFATVFHAGQLIICMEDLQSLRAVAFRKQCIYDLSVGFNAVV